MLVRQRPGSAKGVVFMTLEDETGIANVVVWPNTLERFRKVIMTARLMRVSGRIQRHEDIIHVVSASIEDLSPWLAALSEDAAGLQPPVARADEVKRPDPGSARSPSNRSETASESPRLTRKMRAGHPRDVRIIPKPARPGGPDAAHILPRSRDFH